jgi:hypothetical protein
VGHGYERYFAVTTSSRQLRPKTSRLVTVEWDMESGGCGESERVDVAGEVRGFSIRELNGDGRVDIEFNISEENCVKKTKNVHAVRFVYANGMFSKSGLDEVKRNPRENK